MSRNKLRSKNYYRLREAGFNSKDATKYKDLSNDNIDDIIKRYNIVINDTVKVIPANGDVYGRVVEIIDDYYYIKTNLENVTLAFRRSELEKIYE